MCSKSCKSLLGVDEFSGVCMAYLDGHNPIEGFLLKLVINNISRDDLQVRQPLLLGLFVNILLLSPGIRERRDLGARELLSKV